MPWLTDEAPSEERPRHGGSREPGPQLPHIVSRGDVPVQFTRDAFSWENLSFVRTLTTRAPAPHHRLLFLLERAVADAHPHLRDDLARYVAVHRERLSMIADPMVIDGGRPARHDDALRAQVVDALGEVAGDPAGVAVIIGGATLQALASPPGSPRLVRVPTSARAQIEAALGRYDDVRRSASHMDALAVIEDFRFLETAPFDSAMSGVAEALAIALAEDAGLFGWIRLNASALANGDVDAVVGVIHRAAMRTRAEPPVALGRCHAAVLTALLGDEVTRADALAIGCALDVVSSAACGALDTDALDDAICAIESLGLPTYHPVLDDELPGGRRAVLASLDALRDDHDGERPLTIIREIAGGVARADVDDEIVLRAIDWLRHRMPRR